MGAKAKKAMKKQLSKASAQLSASSHKNKEAAATASTAADFLPLEGGPARKLPEEKPKEDIATVLYIGRIPHGFYEKEMEGFFGQFGSIKRLRIARNKKTGKSKHFGFIEFEDPEVAKVVADTMHNYLLFEHVLQVHLIPPQKVHPKLWKGFNYRVRPVNWVHIERKRHDKERTVEELKKLMEKIMKRDLKRQKKIEAAGIDYKCPEIVGGSEEPAPKKRKTDRKKVVSK
ncbi:uncharacterized RNA-binding protein C1827.05c [Pyrus x bretschneideri]|uniref:uncharacterized RNA-binding protein C1827.05c n=1 Tax=Pyrus x bretschneideri TaxID=225117 RepID=UPI00203075C5|nr:uncharacterized RNA-binding protein C1827.05c [Pyrus x bretschneideri]XP_009353770.2 uncharacterized RNA-binding protein C1827.05c [Pyrus x bretschneideri]XP_009353771.2 uncharacterized RNA-binding protein C1827.05c [Pyrus x bretschneideri]